MTEPDCGIGCRCRRPEPRSNLRLVVLLLLVTAAWTILFVLL